MSPSFRSCLHRAALGALALISASLPARAQTRTVQEGVPASAYTIYVDTVNRRVSIDTGTYRGGVPNVGLFTSSNVVIATTTSPGAGCTIYSTGTIMCLGVKLSTSDPAGVYVPYTGATANVNLGAKTLTTTGNIQVGQVGAGTAASTNFMYDGLSSAGAGYVRIGAGTNQAAGYYWGGTRGYSMQQRYDLTGTPFTLHDELNNVDRFYLDTSGMWYFPSASVTASSFTSLGLGFKGPGTGLTGTGASFTAGLATALAAAGSTSPSGFVARGVDASGNALNAAVDASAISGSTNPVQSGGEFTALAGKVAKAGDTMTGALTVNAPGASITASGGVKGSSGTFTNGVTASSGTFTATGNGQYGVASSTGITIAAGTLQIVSIPASNCVHTDASGSLVGTGSDCGSGGGGSVDVSSFTAIPETIFTQASYALCVATITKTFAAVPLNITVSGAIANNSGQQVGWNVLIDGLFVTAIDGNAYSKSVGMWNGMTTTSQCSSTGPPVRIPAQSAGSHTFCLQLITASGTNARFVNGSNLCAGLVNSVKSFFGVSEAH